MKRYIGIIIFYAISLYSNVTELNVTQFHRRIKSNELLSVYFLSPGTYQSNRYDYITEKYSPHVNFFSIKDTKAKRLFPLLSYDKTPFYILVKSGEVVAVLPHNIGIDSLQKYIEKHYIPLPDEADGVLDNGVRLINIDYKVRNILVYRGDYVSLSLDTPIGYDSLSIDGISYNYNGGLLSFTARDSGAFPLYKYTEGERERVLWIFSKTFSPNVDEEIIFKILSPNEFSKATSTRPGLILDVRTPAEYRRGHLYGAKLLPVQELQRRLPEIIEWSNKPIYIYCRSANRSAVASKILLDAGFIEVYDMERGIIGWESDGLPVVR